MARQIHEAATQSTQRTSGDQRHAGASLSAALPLAGVQTRALVIETGWNSTCCGEGPYCSRVLVVYGANQM